MPLPIDEWDTIVLGSLKAREGLQTSVRKKISKKPPHSRFPPSYGFGRYGFGFSGPGLPSARQMLCGDAHAFFLSF